MKKFSALIGGFVIVLLAVALFNPASAPDLAKPAGLAVRDGTVYLAENRWNSSFIYKADKTGSTELVFTEPRPDRAQRSAILSLVFQNDELFYIRAFGDRSAGTLSRWELVTLGSGDGAYRVLYTRMGAVPILSAGTDALYFTYIGQDGSGADVFEADPRADRFQPELVFSVSAPEDVRFLSAAYDGGKLYCALSDGRVLAYAPQMTGSQSLVPPGAPAALSVSQGGVFFADNSGGTIYYDMGTGLNQAKLPDSIRPVRFGAAVSGSGFALLTDTGLIWYDGTEYAAPVRLKTAPSVNMMLFAESLRGIGLWFILAAALAVILLGLCFISDSFFTRFSAMYAFFTIALLFLVGFLSMAHIKDTALNRRAEALDPEGHAVFIERLRLEEGGAVIESSPRFPAGASYALCYSTEMAGLIEDVMTDGNARTADLPFTDGQRWQVSVSRVIQDGTVELQIVAAGLADVYSGLDRLRSDLFVWGGAAALAVYLILLLFVRRYTGPLRRAVTQMAEIGAGQFEVAEEKTGRGEIGAIQRSIQEMCVSLSIESYKTRVTLESYNRFVPQGLARLLGRSGIAEVECGDAETIDGEVGIVTVSNRDRIRAKTDDGRFMEFVSGSFREIYAAGKEQDAIYISDDFQLSGFRVAFPGGADSGMRFGLSLAGRNTSGETPEFAVLLHTAHYLYGVAGTEERAFTFLSSSELDYLNEVSPELARLGVKLAMTEQYLQKMSNEQDTRYIGFISSPGGRHTLKLYESLNVYPADERRRRLKYESEFQEALRLYYKNDFYLARNLFSAISKESPNDTMARWYLFACEHYFNADDLNKINYSIFGTEKK